MRNSIQLLLVAFCLFLAGCFTVSETEYPQVAVSKLPAGKDIRVQLAGFDASVTTYAAVFGYETVMVRHPGYGWRHGYYYPATVSTTSYVPQVSATKAFIDRATDLLEKGGFVLQTTDPQYRVEVRFDGPYSDNAAIGKAVAWGVLTLLTADYTERSWSARLKIYDVKTGKVIFSNEYEQPYEVLVWGPIPIFSPAGSSKNDSNVMQSWALTALTDRAIADVSSFLCRQ